MSKSLLSPGSIFRLLKETFNDWMEDNALRLSAALAYYSIFSIAPLLIIAVAIAGWFLGSEAAQGLLDDQLRGLLGAQTAQGIQDMVKSASKPSSSLMAGIMGGVALLFGASGVFGQLKDALNTIWEVKPKAGQGVMKFIRERLLSFGMVLVIGFLLLVSLLMTTAISGLANHFGSGLPEVLMTVVSSIISFCVITILFAAIFKFLPDVKIGWKDVWTGAVVTALLFEIGKFLLGLYLGRESTASAYGAAASAVLVLLWVYYASLILFFGAEFTQVYARARGTQIEPNAKAEPITSEARAQQGLEPATSMAYSSQSSQQSPDTNLPQKEDPYAGFVVLKEDSAEFEKIRQRWTPVPVESGFVEKNAVPLVFAGLGGGFIAGALVRRFQPAPLKTPAQEVKDGSQALLLAAGSAIAAYVGAVLARTRQTFEPKELKEKGKWIAHKAHDVFEGAIERFAR